MAVRYDGAVQVLEMLLEEVTTPVTLEIGNGPSDPVSPAEEAPVSPSKRAARAKKVPTTKR
jgi:hypothetical protein